MAGSCLGLAERDYEGQTMKGRLWRKEGEHKIRQEKTGGNENIYYFDYDGDIFHVWDMYYV